MTAKDQLHQKKGVTPFVFILDVLIECFDKDLDRIDLKQVETLVAAFTAVPVKELMKISEGSFFSLLANLADHLGVAGSKPLIEKMVAYDNQTMNYAVQDCPSDVIMRKTLLEIVKHYVVREQSKPALAETLKHLAASDLTGLLSALREVRSLVESGKVPLDHYEAL